ncbi:uncharacterized protein LOC111377012 [Olea europaea var. sylvestris]|uniref:uncharacterized protein LOC111377012 n=1 Tax=Olea europaea var. sylvestris TaxID=158386 RepID=UPI000C1CF21E|nr:uncharacterized protein LOC111377012 [Olea europaea var. sylvestris]XP_022855796.1 uncharacterized protein LOC111377012 [Olea europaea var. sylvestris]XP_022855797.1 uncharacterized protein LOC111377012 [Olea europaea var. sylvestris]XP_022855798.1 uncharacterized protein LOC111377012 [Olea europaea var. sylvestris]
MDVEVEVKPDEGNENETKEEMMHETEDAGGEAPNDVVREIDVYFASPIDPNTRAIKFKVTVKPASSEFEVDLAVNVDSSNYDCDADPKVQITKQDGKPTHSKIGERLLLHHGNHFTQAGMLLRTLGLGGNKFCSSDNQCKDSSPGILKIRKLKLVMVKVLLMWKSPRKKNL